MHRPDTIIEIHRERVQDQTVEMFGGDQYTESVDGTGYSATATLDLTLDRVWFIFDAQQRLWQEIVDNETHDPLRHFAIDLVIFDSTITIDSVSCIPLVSLPPRTITIPDGPRGGESHEIPYNEIPLFGRLTVHDQLEPKEVERGKQSIALDFTEQDAPVLLAGPLHDEYSPQLFGSHVDRRVGKNGVMDLMPTPLEVDPESKDDDTVKDLDAVVQRFDIGGITHESMVIQLQTLRELPSGEELPASILAENPAEKTGLAVTGWSILRQVRDTVMKTFDLDESDFDADVPCLLAGPKTVNIGGQERRLEKLDADIVPRSQNGRLVVDGTVSADTSLYNFEASFTVTYKMGLDDIPRDPRGHETRRADLESVESLEMALRAAGDRKRAGALSDQEYEAEVKRVHDRFDELPKTVGVRPTQNPPEPEVNPDFHLTSAGKAAAATGAAAVVGLLALPVT
jgi:hypothetical protein